MQVALRTTISDQTYLDLAEHFTAIHHACCHLPRIRLSPSFDTEQDIRPAVFALRAFNVETALVADQVRSKEPTVLQMRYWTSASEANNFLGFGTCSVEHQ